MPDRFSLPTVNWLRFGEGADALSDPVPTWPLETILDGAAAAGFPSVGLDLHTVRGGGIPIGDVGAALRSRGLACTDVGILPLGSPALHAATEMLAALADSTGARICVAAPAAELDERRTVLELTECASILAPADVRIALEFVAYFGLTRFAAAAAVCDAVGWESCGLLVDTWHFFRSGAPWRELRELGSGAVALVHVNDGPLEGSDDRVAEGRRHRRPPGGGEFPLAEFAAALGAVGYEGPIGVEVLADDVRERPPAEGARELLHALRETWLPQGPG